MASERCKSPSEIDKSVSGNLGGRRYGGWLRKTHAVRHTQGQRDKEIHKHNGKHKQGNNHCNIEWSHEHQPQRQMLNDGTFGAPGPTMHICRSPGCGAVEQNRLRTWRAKRFSAHPWGEPAASSHVASAQVRARACARARLHNPSMAALRPDSNRIPMRPNFACVLGARCSPARLSSAPTTACPSCTPRAN